MPHSVSCSSLRSGDEDDDEWDGPPLLSERIANPDPNKQFNKQSFDAYKQYSLDQRSGYQNARFDAKRFEETSTVVPKRYDTEPFRTKRAPEQKRKWYDFGGKRNRDEKTSAFSGKRASEDGMDSLYNRSRFPVKNDLETVLSRRSGGVARPRILNPGEAASGEPSPTIIRESTLSEGDISSLLNGR